MRCGFYYFFPLNNHTLKSFNPEFCSNVKESFNCGVGVKLSWFRILNAVYRTCIVIVLHFRNLVLSRITHTHIWLTPFRFAFGCTEIRDKPYGSLEEVWGEKSMLLICEYKYGNCVQTHMY